MGPSERELLRRLEQIVRGTPWLLRVLETIRPLGLPDWYLAAGAVRNTVWDSLHGLATSGPLGDLDVIYFDRTNSWTTAQATLQAVLPEYRWEVTNQATVHQWQSSATGREILGYESIAAAVAGWPETATAVGVRLTPRGAMKFVAPFGLADLFTMTVRRGPMAPDPSAFDLRLRDKAWHLRWPQLTVVRGAG